MTELLAQAVRLAGVSRSTLAGGDLNKFNIVLCRREHSHKNNHWHLSVHTHARPHTLRSILQIVLREPAAEPLLFGIVVGVV